MLILLIHKEWGWVLLMRRLGKERWNKNPSQKLLPKVKIGRENERIVWLQVSRITVEVLCYICIYMCIYKKYRKYKYIKFGNCSWRWLTNWSVLGSGTWDYCSNFLSDLPAYHVFHINSIVAQKSSAAGYCLQSKTRKSPHPGFFTSTEFPHSSQTVIFTVLQTSFHPPTFVHSFPLYDIPFFPFFLLIEILSFL